MNSSTIIIAFLAIGTLFAISAATEEVTTQRVEEVITEEPSYVSLLRTRCEANGASDAFEVAKNAPAVFQTCTESLYNLTGVRHEALDAKKAHELKTFFNIYCASTVGIIKCYADFDAAMAPCMTVEERNKQKIAHNLTASLYNFACENEAAFFMSFAETGGIECFDEVADMSGCINSLRNASRMVDSSVSITYWPRMDTPQDCKFASDLQKCFVDSLKVCPDPTPSTLAATLFNRIKQVSPCGIPPTDPVPKSNAE